MSWRARETFFHGREVEEAGTLRPDGDPLVAAYPAHYEPVEDAAPARRGPGRPPGAKNKPKAGAADG